MSLDKPRVVVVGSINMDLVVSCDQIPAPGETRLAAGCQEICGGKGANQAVAAARAGGDVAMIGRVGNDAFADRLRDNLAGEGIDVESVQSTPDHSSGLAVVAVASGGENSILVVPGANGQLRPADIEAARAVIEQADVLLVQLEVPLDTVLAAMDIARRVGVTIVFDPAPAPSTWPSELLQVDLCCPNESEAASCVGHAIDTIEQAETAARAIGARGAKNVAITLGHRGVLLYANGQTHVVDPLPVTVIDTTAAGDAFAGALAVHWAQYRNLLAAVRFGTAAAALSVSRFGAQPAMPFRPEIDALL